MKLLQVSDLVVRRSKTFSLDVPHLQLEAGKILCVTGPNGSGKTTLIEAITGLIRPNAGTVRLAGQPVNNDLRSTKSLLGFVPDDEEWFVKGLTAHEYLRLLTSVYRDAGVTYDMTSRIEELASILHFTAFSQLLEELSHGNKKKVQLIAGLMHQPQVVVLDELRNGLDPMAIIEAERLVKNEAKRGACVVATTHDLWWAERIADEILLIIDGKPAVHAPTIGLVKKYGSLEKLFLKMVQKK